MYGVGANRNRQESVSENKEKGGVEAELISKTIWIDGNPRAPLVESNEQVEQTVQAGKSRGVRGISPDAAIFLIYRRFAPFHRSVPSPLPAVSKREKYLQFKIRRLAS